MKGIIYKDYLVQRGRIIGSLMIAIGVCLFFFLIVMSILYGNIKSIIENTGLANDTNISSLLNNCSICFSFITASIATYMIRKKEDEGCGFEKIEFSIPVSDAKRIASKYIVFVSTYIVTLIIYFSFCVLIYHVAGVDFKYESVRAIISGYSVMLILSLFDMVLVYTTRGKVSEYIHMVLIFILFSSVIFLINYIIDSVSADSLKVKISSALNILTLAFPFALTFGIAVSWMVSSIICKKRRG